MATRTILYAVSIKETGAAATKVAVEKIGTAADRTKAKVAGMATSMRPAFRSTGDELSNLSGGLFRVIAGFGFAGVALNKLIAGNREWDRSTSAMGKQLDDIRGKIADAFGPTAAGYLKTFLIGIAGISGALSALPEALEIARSSMVVRGPDGDKSASWTDIALGFLTADPRLQSATPDVGPQQSVADKIGTAVSKSVEQALGDLARIYADPNLGGKGGGSRPNYAGAITPGMTGGSLLPAQSPAASQFDLMLKATSARLDDVAKQIPGAFDHIFEALEQVTADAEKRKANIANGLGAAATISSLDPNGPMLAQVGALFGPIGAAIGTLADNFREIPDILTGLVDQVIGVLTDLPETIGTLIGETIPAIIDALPELFGELATLTPRIIEAIVSSLPQLVGALITMWPKIAAGVVRAMIDAFKTFFSVDFWLGVGKAIGQSIAQAVTDALNVFKDKQGRFLGTDLTGGNKHLLGLDLEGGTDLRGHNKSLLGIRLPSFDVGTDFVQNDGPAYLHRGERVETADENRRRMRGGMGHNITINVNGAQNPRAVVEEIRRSLGSFGLGLSLDPLVG